MKRDTWIGHEVWRGSIIALGAWMAVASAWGDTVFLVDPSQSSIALSGDSIGFTFAEQEPGSLTTRFGGTLRAEVTDQAIAFTGQSLLEAENSGEWEPKGDGSSGREPANYGAKASSLLGQAKAALRRIQLDLTSPPIALDQGRFDSGNVVFFFPENAPSTLDYSVSSFLLNDSGSAPLSGYATNKVTTQASLMTVGDQQILTIPVDAQYKFSLMTDDDTKVRLKGQLVARRQALAPLVIQSITVRTQIVTLEWQSAPGQAYQVQSSPDLKAWETNAVGVTSTTGAYSWSGAAAALKAFFRLAQ